MAENTQEIADNVTAAIEPEEKIIEQPIVEKSDTIETEAKVEESVTVEQTKETHDDPEDQEEPDDQIDQEDPEDQENQEDFNSARSRSDTECTDSRTEDEDDASVILEREEGDGQESTPNRKVDDDEDKRNPQYIPKKGTFYEHDDRTAADEGEEEVKEAPEEDKSDKDAAGKKKVWSEKEANKWSHDRFNDQEQAPKSRQELISIYGYDIRNEEGPPRARRRRRYGRGPNKYTRNWEDEDAYSKPTNVSAKPVQRKPRTKPGQDEFPPLNPEDEPEDQRSDSKSSERTDNDNANVTISQISQEEKENREKPHEKERKDENEMRPRRDLQNPRMENRSWRNVQKRKEEQQSRASVTNNVRGITKTRGYFKNGGRGNEQTRARNQRNQKPNSGDEYSDYILSQNFTNKNMSHQQQQQQQQQQQNVQKLEKDMANMTMQQTGNEGQPTTNNSSYTGTTTTRGGKFGNSGGRQTSVPPRLQQEQRGSKRYSSLRQRSLPETANFGPQPSYFQADYPQQSTTQAQPQAGLLPHPQVTSTITVQPPPPQFTQPYAQPPPAFLQPAVAPPGVPPFIPQQPPPPQIINYAQPPQFTGQFNQYQHQHQHQQFNPVNQAPQPAELFQPQGGITYYSAQHQQIPRAPPKRVKSAIPIVPPPEHKEPRGRGRFNQSEQDSPGGSAADTPADNYELQQNCEFTADAPVAIQQQ